MRLAGIVAVAAATAVAAAGCQSSAPGPSPDSIWPAGTCIQVENGADALGNVPCFDPHSHVVTQRLTAGAACPAGTALQHDTPSNTFCLRPDPFAGVDPASALDAVGLAPAADVTFGVAPEEENVWALGDSWIQNDTARQISVPWEPTLLRWNGKTWESIGCHNPEDRVGLICEGRNAAPHVLPTGRTTKILDLLAWPPSPPTPGIYAVVVPVWPRGLDTAETPPTQGLVEVLALGI